MNRLEQIAEQIRLDLASRDATREKVLPLCRETIRHASNAIRAIHRHEFELAAELLQAARKLVGVIEQAACEYAELHYSGFVRDAQKEFAEGSITLALVTGKEIPDPAELGVDVSAYLNGLGEAVGELRRYLLDSIRGGDPSKCEELLSIMDDVYGVLVTMDFPDALTGGLRRTTDVVRGVLEKTRSDLTLIMSQQELENKLRHFTQNG